MPCFDVKCKTGLLCMSQMNIDEILSSVTEVLVVSSSS
jgi:hypothetical protein